MALEDIKRIFNGRDVEQIDNDKEHFTIVRCPEEDWIENRGTIVIVRSLASIGDLDLNQWILEFQNHYFSPSGRWQEESSIIVRDKIWGSNGWLSPRETMKYVNGAEYYAVQYPDTCKYPME